LDDFLAIYITINLKFAGFAFGDILTQIAQQRASGSFSLDMKKTMVMMVSTFARIP
jgi:hypothetical protein